MTKTFDDAYTFTYLTREKMGILTVDERAQLKWFEREAMENENEPRGIRNNNPGNIKHGENWFGLDPARPDDTFCTFLAPFWGIRAMFKILQTYRHKHGLDTVEKIIKRWAPPSENDTKRYTKYVASVMDVKPDEKLEWEEHVMTDLVKAICVFENGRQGYDASVYASAWRNI